MSFLSRIFGKTEPLSTLRRALDQRRLADALAIGHSLDRAGFGESELAELELLLTQAGDELAAVNLSEGEACLRAGDGERAAEHFALASSQARSADLVLRIRQAALQMDPTASDLPQAVPAHPCTSGCSSTDCAPTPSERAGLVSDASVRLDLVLCGYPPELAARYQRLSGSFLDAFLAAHEGEDDRALEFFELVPAGARDDLFYFERGSLLGRLGRGEEACEDLKRSIELNPELTLAREALVGVLLAGEQDLEAEKILAAMLEGGIAPGFSHGRMMIVCARRGDLEAALQHGLSSVNHGCEGDTILAVASLLEKKGRIAEVEALLETLPAGGCSGINVHLAEFSLRHGMNIDKALESFKGALRQEPGNPRWALRIAQAYLAKGWKKEGLSLLTKTLADPTLDAILKEEGSRLLDRHRIA
ncbi:hypothetical protein DSOUD_1904 [Desulfuromonas soudanensis]|uniref:Tetratricopeptide repeat protein n=1 Tax=Desulfuromonas soudanensis TaxID=1603606 RepID=A0A0M4DHT9_9BACT|nr:hypothetical protein [Desulfuromonas soudanensis]ALC16675.1 hypothetical protein DSOUD_1904 [Desulfuromonas soudanensis]